MTDKLKESTDWKAVATKYAEAEARAVQYGQRMTTVAAVLFALAVLLVLVIGSSK